MTGNMAAAQVKVEIMSATRVGGRYPFVAACLDDDLSNELFKTKATTGGPTATWNETFDLDLALAIKNHRADGKPEPSYLTFFLFDTGAEGIPSLGSAGVLLQTLYDNQVAEGDFPVINGNNGVLTLVVRQADDKRWYSGNVAKIAAGAVGVGAITAGLTALAVNKKKKKKEAAERDRLEEEEQNQSHRDLLDEDDDIGDNQHGDLEPHEREVVDDDDL